LVTLIVTVAPRSSENVTVIVPFWSVSDCDNTFSGDGVGDGDDNPTFGDGDGVRYRDYRQGGSTDQ
jgi:hypothetical protein